MTDGKTILDRLSGVRVLVVGDVMLDRYWWGSVNRISPEAPVPVVRLERTSEVAGGAANVAANVVGLGANATLVGVIGADEEGRVLSRLLERAGIPANHLISVPGRQTTVKTRIIAHSQQVVRLDHESAGKVSLEDRELQKIADLAANADVVIVSDYAKGFLTDEFTPHLITACEANGRKVLVDPKGKDFSKYKGASVLTPNRREALEACKLDEGGPEVFDAAGRILLESVAAEAVLVTLGDHGMRLFRRERTDSFEALARMVYDVTGAGDTVIATLATAVGAGFDYYEAAGLANVAAGLVVEQIGTTAISRAVLQTALERDLPEHETD